MDEREEIDAVEWLKSVAEPAERARFAREFDWINESEPEMDRYLTGQCLSRVSSEEALLAAIRGAPDLTKEGRRNWRRIQRAIENVQRRDEIARARGLRVRRSVWARTEAVPTLKASASMVHGTSQNGGEMNSDAGAEMAARAEEVGPALIEAPRAEAPSVLIDKPRPDVRPPRGSLTERIAIEAYENQRKIWRHLKTPRIPKPAWYDAYRAEKERADEEVAARVRDPSNPFDRPLPVPRRSADLTWNEVMKVYRAMAFSLDEGVLMTAHVVIVWSMCGVTDHERASKLTGQVLHEVRKWAAVGKPSDNRQRRRARTGDGFDLAWIYAHENDRVKGLHTHILMNVPPSMAKAFEAWLWLALRRLTKNEGHRRALRVVPSRARTEADAIRRHWGWMTYVVKGLPPSVELEYRGQKSLGPLRDVMKLYPYRGDASAMFCDELVGVSRNLDKKPQKEAGFVSKLDLGPAMLDRLYDGSEFREGERRREINEMLATLTL